MSPETLKFRNKFSSIFRVENDLLKNLIATSPGIAISSPEEADADSNQDAFINASLLSHALQFCNVIETR